MKVLYIIEIFILVTILYFCVTLLSVFLVNKESILGLGINLKDKIILQDFDDSNIYSTNCNSHPKKCPTKNCDCSQLCDSRSAKKIEIKNGHYENELFLNYTDGVYCYKPVGDTCKNEFGSWIYVNKKWICVPKFYGIFTTSGEQLVGSYPFSENQGNLSWKNTNRLNVDYNDPEQYKINCSNLKDEYGKTLLTFTLDSGLSYCLKDYCLSSLQEESKSSGYENGICLCRGDTENFLLGDFTSPCVPVKGTNFQKPMYNFKVNCFNNTTFVKDIDDYLFECSSDDKINYITSNPIFITTNSI